MNYLMLLKSLSSIAKPLTELSNRDGGGGGMGGHGTMDVPPFWPPVFDILGIELDLFGVLFLIHQHQNDLLGY